MSKKQRRTKWTEEMNEQGSSGVQGKSTRTIIFRKSTFKSKCRQEERLYSANEGALGR